MARTARQRVEELKAEIAAKQDIAEWLEDVWSDVVETQHMASHLSNHIEDMLDSKRGKVDQRGCVTFVFSRESIELAEWTAGRVWAGLKTLDERITARINAITAEENAANDPRTPKVKKAAGAA